MVLNIRVEVHRLLSNRPPHGPRLQRGRAVPSICNAIQFRLGVERCFIEETSLRQLESCNFVTSQRPTESA